jgi:hypothetical protein
VSRIAGWRRADGTGRFSRVVKSYAGCILHAGRDAGRLTVRSETGRGDSEVRRDPTPMLAPSASARPEYCSSCEYPIVFR